VADKSTVIEDLIVEATMLSLKDLVGRVKDGTATHQDFNVIRQWAKDNDVNINSMTKESPFATLLKQDVPLTEEDVLQH